MSRPVSKVHAHAIVRKRQAQARLELDELTTVDLYIRRMKAHLTYVVELHRQAAHLPHTLGPGSPREQRALAQVREQP